MRMHPCILPKRERPTRTDPKSLQAENKVTNATPAQKRLPGGGVSQKGQPFGQSLMTSPWPFPRHPLRRAIRDNPTSW